MHNVLDLKYCARRTRIDLPLVRMKSQSCKDWGGWGDGDARKDSPWLHRQIPSLTVLLKGRGRFDEQPAVSVTTPSQSSPAYGTFLYLLSKSSLRCVQDAVTMYKAFLMVQILLVHLSSAP